MVPVIMVKKKVVEHRSCLLILYTVLEGVECRRVNHIFCLHLLWKLFTAAVHRRCTRAMWESTVNHLMW